MHRKSGIIIATSLLLAVAASLAQAAPGDPPASSMDLGAIKPKSDTTSASTPGGIQPIGQSMLSKQKAAADAANATAPVKTGMGTGIPSPLGAKGVLGGSSAAGASAQQDTAPSSNDVVVKMPSNMKK